MFSCFASCKDREGESGQDLLEQSSGDSAGVWKRLAAEERRYQQEAERHRQEVKRRAGEAQALRQAEEGARQQTQDLAQQVREAQRAFREEQARYEGLRRERELAEHATATRRAEAKRLLEERERWVRKTGIMAFLKENGFAGVNIPKKFMTKMSFPLHAAAEAGNARMIEMLLKEGADPNQRNSAGKTAAHVAQARDNHDAARVLAAAARAPAIGGA